MLWRTQSATTRKTWIVEVVSDSARQLTYGLHFLRLKKPRFSLASLLGLGIEHRMRQPKLRRRRERQQFGDKGPKKYGCGNRGDCGDGFDDAFETVCRRPKRIDRHHVRDTARHDESGESPEYPTELNVPAFPDEVGEREWDGEVG